MVGLSQYLALSIRQPWASLIMSGKKSIEVRSWSTRYRGRLIVHAGRKADDLAANYLGVKSEQYRGGYLGAVELDSIKPFDRFSWSRERAYHLNPGPMPGDVYAWYFKQPRTFANPVPGSGKVGIFPIPEDDLNTILVDNRWLKEFPN